MPNLVIRKAQPADYPGILALHRENLISNLPASQRQDGFLSLDITESQIAQANEDFTAIVARVDMPHSNNPVIGYVWGTTPDYNRQYPLIKAMMALYPSVEWQSRPLSNYRLFIYGPVCVAKAYRGQGVLQALFQELLQQASGRYEAGSAFVAKDNPRSLFAHTQKLGMEPLREFEFKSKNYVLLGFPVPS